MQEGAGRNGKYWNDEVVVYYYFCCSNLSLGMSLHTTIIKVTTPSPDE